MVVLTEVKKMFWGVSLDEGKRYTQYVDHSFHVSMAAIEPAQNNESKGEVTSVMIQQDKAEFVLCTLEKGKIYQQPLDLNFTKGEEVTFFLNGKGVVHLTGYLIEDEFDTMEDSDDDPNDTDYLGHEVDMSSEEEESDDEEVPDLSAITESGEDSEVSFAAKRKKKQKVDVKKKMKVSDDEDSSFFDAEAAEDSDSEMESDDEDDDDDDLDSDEFDSDEWDDLSDDDEDMSSDEDEEIETSVADTPQSSKKLQQKDAKAKKDTPKNKPKTPQSKEGQKTPQGKGPKTPQSKEGPKTPQTGKSPKLKGETPANANAQETPKSAKQKKKSKENKENSSPPSKGADKASPSQSPKTPKQENLSLLQETPNGATPSTEKRKKKKKKNKGQNTPGPDGDKSVQKTPSQKSQPNTPGDQKSKTPKKSVMKGGVVAEDTKDGHGPEAKGGKMVHVYYTGRLQNGKVFDSTTSGKPFKFRLGKKEVIEGWDVGLEGMKVGGKRKLVIPAKMGYGNQRAGEIPPNSSLTFEVELKAVS